MGDKKINKGAVITRLVIWSVVAALLITIFTVLMAGGEVNVSGSFMIFGGEYYGDTDKYNVGNKTYGEEIKNIKIHWTDGSVNFVIREGDGIEIKESGAGEREDYKMRSRVVGDMLEIRFVKSGFWFVSLPHKELTVYIPPEVAMSLGELKISSASAKVTLGDKGADGTVFDCKSVSVECVSGDMNVYGVRADKLSVKATSARVTVVGKADKVSMDGVSGDLRFEGELGELDVEAVSGKVSLVLENTPNDIDASTVSGNIEITLPESKSGFEAELDAISGRMSLNSKNVGRYCNYGDGKADFDFETVSGDVIIKTKKVSE